MDRLALVAVGGAAGSVPRDLTNGLAVRWLGLDFPYGTLIVNVVGSFLIGLVQALAREAVVLPEGPKFSSGMAPGFASTPSVSSRAASRVCGLTPRPSPSATRGLIAA